MTSTRFSLPFLLLLEMVLAVNWAGAQVPVPSDPLPPQVPPSSSNYAYQNQTPTSQPTPGYNYSAAPNNGNQRFNNPDNPPRQGLGGGAGGAGRAGIMRMVQQLGLTDDQRQQIMQIIRNTADKQERRQQIVALLTPEQRQRLRGMMREMMQRRQGEQGPGGQGQQQGGGVPPMNPNSGDAQPETQAPTNYNGNGPRFAPYDPKPVQPLNL